LRLKRKQPLVDSQRENENQREGQQSADRSGFIHLEVPPGVNRARATRLEPLRIEREELLTEIDARETAATSPPTLNGSRMSFPLNCAANSGRSTEKYPYGSWFSVTITPVRWALRSRPTRIFTGPSYPRSRGSSSVVQNA